VKPPRSPRVVAAQVLDRIERDEAWSQRVLAAELGRRPMLELRDRRLVTRLVYGTLQWQGTLDYRLSRFVRQPLARTDPVVRRVLRIGAFQILLMRDVPGHAVVHSAVEAAKALRRPRAAGFVNAVLRKLLVARDEPDWPDPEEDPVGHLAARGSMPHWLAERWLARLGMAEALELATANNGVPPLTVRVQAGRREALLARVREDAEGEVEVTPVGRAGAGLTVRPSGGLITGSALADGLCVVQDEASMLITELLDPQPGERVLDACAAPGGKTGHIAMLVGDSGHVAAVDLHAGRCRQIEETMARLALDNVRVQAADLRTLKHAAGGYDRVLLDAPCSGLGTVRRHPEVRWRREPADVDRLAERQRELLSAVADQTRPGGVLVYAVCSTEPEEGEAVVEGFLDRQEGGWTLEAPAEVAFAGLVEGPGWVRTWPHRDGLDGFFAVRLRRND